MQASHQQVQKHGALPVPGAQSLQYPSPLWGSLVHPLGQAQHMPHMSQSHFCRCCSGIHFSCFLKMFFSTSFSCFLKTSSRVVSHAGLGTVEPHSLTNTSGCSKDFPFPSFRSLLLRAAYSLFLFVVCFSKLFLELAASSSCSCSSCSSPWMGESRLRGDQPSTLGPCANSSQIAGEWSQQWKKCWGAVAAIGTPTAPRSPRLAATAPPLPSSTPP